MIRLAVIAERLAVIGRDDDDGAAAIDGIQQDAQLGVDVGNFRIVRATWCGRGELRGG